MNIAVVSESQEAGGSRVRVFTGTQEATGATLGAALDALHLAEETWDGEPYLLLRRFRADRFFPSVQRERLAALMAQWRESRDSGHVFPAALQSELESLVEAEQEGMVTRSQALIDATRK